jgi:hypothetical protein
MKKARIVEVTNVIGEKSYVIEQRHFLFKWWWVNASNNSMYDCNDIFPTLEAAKQNLPYFDGTKGTRRVVG